MGKRKKRLDTSMQVMHNPRLDKIFTEAYRSTMKKVELREADKHASDYLNTFSDFFREDLNTRDLSPEERDEFMKVFHQELAHLNEKNLTATKKRKRALIIAGSSTAGALALSFGLFTATARPFMPLPKIESQIVYYLEKVDEGFGSYSKKFYSLVDRHSRKVPDIAEQRYRTEMYTYLEEHFDSALEHLENGEIRFYDDAKQWASRFPEVEERQDRKEQADNAFRKGLGTAVGDSLEEVKEGARDLIKKATDFIKDTIDRED
ncbi:MAG: hypothetical protein CMN78_00140 [Spirochaetales bacterium]|nr:hypothetical protein [Spirochaetales bacterium]